MQKYKEKRKRLHKSVKVKFMIATMNNNSMSKTITFHSKIINKDNINKIYGMYKVRNMQINERENINS